MMQISAYAICSRVARHRAVSVESALSGEQQAGVIIINICTHDGGAEETKTDIFHEKFDVIRQINKFSPRAHDQQLVAARHRARDI